MDSVESHAEQHWDLLHSQLRYRPRFPHDEVVRFLFGNFPRQDNRHLRALDVGVGAGRHTKLLCDLGFQTSGVDLSSEGLLHCQAWLASSGQSAQLQKASMRELPFPDGEFDAGVAFGVLYYNDRAGMERSVGELHRVLRDGGKAVIVVRTSDDYRCGKGARLEPNTYRLEIADTNEEGSVMHFLDEAEVPVMFGGFRELSFEKSETTFAGRQHKNSDWLIRVTK